MPLTVGKRGAIQHPKRAWFVCDPPPNTTRYVVLRHDRAAVPGLRTQVPAESERPPPVGAPARAEAVSSLQHAGVADVACAGRKISATSAPPSADDRTHDHRAAHAVDERPVRDEQQCPSERGRQRGGDRVGAADRRAVPPKTVGRRKLSDCRNRVDAGASVPAFITVPSTATPSAPPISLVVSLTAEPTPALGRSEPHDRLRRGRHRQADTEPEHQERCENDGVPGAHGDAREG